MPRLPAQVLGQPSSHPAGHPGRVHRRPWIGVLAVPDVPAGGGPVVAVAADLPVRLVVAVADVRRLLQAGVRPVRGGGGAGRRQGRGEEEAGTCNWGKF